MRFSTIVSMAAVPLAMAAPILEKRGLSTDDTMVLELALFLEHLEYALYSAGYASFTDAQYTAAGFPAGFRANIEVIAQVSLPNTYHSNFRKDQSTKLSSKRKLMPTSLQLFSPPTASPLSVLATIPFPSALQPTLST